MERYPENTQVGIEDFGFEGGATNLQSLRSTLTEKRRWMPTTGSKEEKSVGGVA